MSKTQLGPLQLDVMRVLWARGEATAQEVHAALSAEREIAPTTVATILKRLDAAGTVAYRKDGRRHVYRPRIDERAVRTSMVGDIVDTLFDGRPAALVSHLLGDEALDPDEVDRLRRLLDAYDAGREAGEN